MKIHISANFTFTIRSKINGNRGPKSHGYIIGVDNPLTLHQIIYAFSLALIKYYIKAIEKSKQPLNIPYVQQEINEAAKAVGALRVVNLPKPGKTNGNQKN